MMSASLRVLYMPFLMQIAICKLQNALFFNYPLKGILGPQYVTHKTFAAQGQKIYRKYKVLKRAGLNSMTPLSIASLAWPHTCYFYRWESTEIYE